MAPASLSITVIIVNYNSGHRLAWVLEALAKQTFEAFDVVVLDNASADRSHEIDAPDGLKLDIVRSETNTGFAGGVMAALPHAKGDWCAILNPDAYPEEGWLAALAAAAAAYGPEAALGSVQHMVDPADRLDGIGDVYHISGTAWRGGFGQRLSLAPDDDRDIFAPCFAAAMVERSRFERLGGLDTDFFCYHEDVDYGFRNRLAGGTGILVADAIVRHEGSAITGRYSAFTVYHSIRNRMWTFIKNMPLGLWPLALPAYILFALAFLFRSFMLGIGRPYMRGWWAGLMGLSRAWRKRQSVMDLRTAPLKSIMKSLTWSPVAPLRRAPDLRPLPPRPR